MSISIFLWKTIQTIITIGMRITPRWTLWFSEKVIRVAPEFFRKVADEYTSSRILACVVGGDLPAIPGLNGGDGILFYPLEQCVRYELLGFPELAPRPLFEGKILAFFVPPEERKMRYRVCGYDAAGRCYDAGNLHSRSHKGEATRIRKEVGIQPNRITWDVMTDRYLTSFLMIHSMGKPHAAGYSQKKFWDYPDTTYLPHIVIPPDGTELDKEGVSVMVMVVDTDAWVSELLIGEAKMPRSKLRGIFEGKSDPA